MKKVYLLLCFLCICLHTKAQNNKQHEEYRGEIWHSTPTFFDAQNVPAEWDTENVVILSKKVDYEVGKRLLANVLDEELRVHVRLKVLNNDGVKDFSELKIDVPGGYDLSSFIGPNLNVKFFFGANVIKKNGSQITMTEKDLVKLELNDGSDKYSRFKVAMPDLEAGDIIDYYFRIKLPHLAQEHFESSSFEFMLAGAYPIVYQEYNILINKKCYLSSNTFNGAPDIKQLMNESSFDHYQLIDHNRPKYTYERWTFPMMSVPFIKYKIHFVKNILSDFPNSSFPNFKRELKLSLNKEQFISLAEYYNNNLTTPARILDYRDLRKYLKKHHKEVKDPAKRAQLAYYFFRHNNMTNNHVYSMLNNYIPWYRLSDTYFVAVFSAFLDYEDIDYEVIFTTSRETGLTIDQAMFSDDLRVLIAVINKDNSRTYYQACTKYSKPNDLDEYIQGMPAYAVGMFSRNKGKEFNEIVLPVSTSDGNKEVNEYQVTVSLQDEPGISIKHTGTANGLQKESKQISIAVGYTLVDAYNRYGMNVDVRRFCKNKQYIFKASEAKKYPLRESELRELQKSDLYTEHQKQLQSHFSTKQLTLKNVHFIKAGIWGDVPEFLYVDEFVINDFVQPVGQNYLLEIGRLIGEQVAIENNELIRINDIQSDFAKEFENKIELIIPEGYLAEGIENLNMKVFNTTGSFTSRAIQENGRLIIVTQKVYSNRNTPKEKWSDMVAFLDLAYKFSQQKILLKKSIKI